MPYRPPKINLRRRLGARRWMAVALALVAGHLNNPPAIAKDHVLTIGGGYAPEGNQASLEANVLFFQRVLKTARPKTSTHRIHFADGFDPAADLQIVLAKNNDQPQAVQILEEIFAPPGPVSSQRVGYRNHRVPQISGSNRITDIRAAMDIVKAQVKSGDRLIVYVTAHGGSAKGSDPYDTSITCWGNRELSMRETARWLDTLPPDLSVVLVMAQCYCGGFSHTIFSEGDSAEGISANIRTGFFAQRHDLPAAGCRPDIENDEEYSSYFWGALIGQTRSGKPIQNVDCDADGQISLAEAHAYAVVASETIDIPLRGSDTLLREISRIAYYDLEESRPDKEESESLATPVDAELVAMTGSLGDCMRLASPVQRRIVEGLTQQLKLGADLPLTQVFSEYNDALREYREARRGGFGPSRRGRGSFGRRRELREALVEKWPELDDQQNWRQAPVLADAASQIKFVKELEQLPAYQAYLTSRQQREESRGKTLGAEMQQVRLRRLIHTLESIVLAANVEKVATPEMIERYRQMIKLEEAQ